MFSFPLRKNGSGTRTKLLKGQHFSGYSGADKHFVSYAGADGGNHAAGFGIRETEAANADGDHYPANI